MLRGRIIDKCSKNCYNVLMSDSSEYDPRPIGEILPEIVDILEHGEPIEPDSKRHQQAKKKDLETEIADLKVEREEIGRVVVAGDTSAELQHHFERVTNALLDAQAEHIQTDGTVGGVPPRE